MRYVCKNCKESEGLYIEGAVDAWRTIEIESVEGKPRIKPYSYHDDKEVLYWNFAADIYGCSTCDTTWYPLDKGIICLDRDDKEIEPPIKGQEELHVGKGKS